jgi:hypothetical protein
MKIAVVSESSADEAAVKILIDAILGTESTLIPLRTRPNGWPSVLNLIPNIIAGLYYGTEAEALVVVVDSDDSPIHEQIHDMPGPPNLDCRLCKLRITTQSELAKTQPMLNRIPLKTALGLAVPAIEAWYRCGLDAHVTEFEWNRKLRGERLTYDKRSLKLSAYGAYPVTNFEKHRIARAAAQRLATVLDELQRQFPCGFGALLTDLRQLGG